MLSLLLTMSLAQADVIPPDRRGKQAPPPPAAEAAPAEPVAQTPCDEGLDSAILTLRLTGERDAYECLAAAEEAQPALITAMEDGEAQHPERVSRALALWRLHRLDREIPPEEARALLPVDRRLLADGVRAFRGRETPSEAHKLVLEQLDWYQPTPQYVDARLTEQDRANLATINDPPKPEVAAPEGAADAMPTEIPPPQPAQSSGCGCATGGGGPASPALLLALIALVYRRRSIC